MSLKERDTAVPLEVMIFAFLVNGLVGANFVS